MDKKSNLFIVFTPLQLFVAQQIIRQEKLENCVLIEGYQRLFADTFNMMRMENLWYDRIEFGDIAKWDGFSLNTYRDVKKCWNNYKVIKNFAEKHRVSTIYLGEVLNQACRFTAVLFSHQGYKIAFFEEGTSHYIDRPYKEHKSLKKQLKEWLYDYFYFIPIYHIRFAKWRLNPNMPYDKLPMNKRYSIIPFHNESYDVRLYVKPMFSPKLTAYVDSNIPNNNEKGKIMLLTDPLRELMKEKDLYLYYETIDDCLHEIDENSILYIKFHPRERENSRERIIQLAENSGVNYKILSEEVNICVEYYLQRCKFDKIYFFNAATYFYNGYAFPKTEFVKLMPVVYKKAKDAGVENLEYMENMLKMIEPLSLNSN